MLELFPDRFSNQNLSYLLYYIYLLYNPKFSPKKNWKIKESSSCLDRKENNFDQSFNFHDDLLISGVSLKNSGGFCAKLNWEKWVTSSFAWIRRTVKRMDQRARGLGGLRGKCLLRRSSCTDKLCQWQFISTSCLRGLTAPCLGELGRLARGATLSPIHFLMENRYL